MMESCYMCDRRATSKEHVPPRCFFPEKKDLPQGEDYRVNLITVLSCELHNLSKSEDDLYLLSVIVAYYKNNSVAQRHFSTKMLRAIERSPWLRETYTRKWSPVLVGSTRLPAFDVDRRRVIKSLTCIVNGLHFHHYREQWSHDILIYTPPLLYMDGPEPPQRVDVKRAFDTLSQTHLENQPRLGVNREVFYYQTYRDEQGECLLVRMAFYRGFVVYGFSSTPDWTPPSQLTDIGHGPRYSDYGSREKQPQENRVSNPLTLLISLLPSQNSHRPTNAVTNACVGRSPCQAMLWPCQPLAALHLPAPEPMHECSA